MSRMKHQHTRIITNTTTITTTKGDIYDGGFARRPEKGIEAEIPYMFVVARFLFRNVRFITNSRL